MESRTVADPEALVLEHHGLARHLAQRYVRGGEEREDLEQVACLGLVKAARRFDPQRGVAFTTFAMPTILGELRRFCRDTRWAVRVPRIVQERVQALRRIEDEHVLEHGRAPSTAKAAEILGWPEEDVLEARLAAGGLSSQSLNVVLHWPDGAVGEAIDSLGAEDTGFADAERHDELQNALAQMSVAERRALRLRGEMGCSTPEIARQMGLSPSQTARLVAHALARLRAALDGGAEPARARDQRVVHLVEADPDLFAALDASALSKARGTAVARRLTLEPGHWAGPARDGTALLVLGGAMLRSVALGGPPRAELIGPGDVLRGYDEDRAIAAQPAWQVVEPTELAILDAPTLDVLCAWPPVVHRLLARASERSNALALQLAITDQRRVDDRLLSLFRAIGNRWGRRTRDGVAISLPLTHDMIAMLAGAHRPTVTSALRRLSRAGRLRRSRGEHWLLTEDGAGRLPIAA